MLRIDELESERVETIRSDATIREAADRMARAAIGSLCVVDQAGLLKGIVTDRDLCLRAVAVGGSDLHERTVESVMSSPVETVAPGDDIETGIHRMRTHGIRRIPIVSEGRPEGMLALDDVLELLTGALHELSIEASVKRRHALRRARYEQARSELDGMLEEVRERLAMGKWYAREALLDELDQLKATFRSTLERHRDH